MPITPGEWFLGTREYDAGEWEYDGSVWAPPLPEDVKFHEEYPDRHGPPEPVEVVLCDHEPDAHLISAAPNMLAALDGLAPLLLAVADVAEEHGDPGLAAELRRRGHACGVAVKKAKGEST